MKNITTLLVFLCCQLMMIGQDVVKINSNNGLSKITYVVSDSYEEDKIDLILSSISLGVEEYRIDKTGIDLVYEEVPPFLTLKCKTGTCIERINHYESVKKQALPILLTNSELRNTEIIHDLNKMFSSTVIKNSELEDDASQPSSTIALRRMDSGTFGVDVTLNEIVTEEFILDSGASFLSINSTVFENLRNEGTIRDFDYLDVVYATIADGSIVENFLFNISKVTIGQYEFNNIKCIVSPNQNAPLLLGQNLLRAFGTISIDYEKNKLHIVD
ncbi:MAG: retropepsin-like aspartic protease [Bacteroidota bacterium]